MAGAAKKKAGRPKGATSAAPSQTVSTRITKDQVARLDRLRAEGGYTIGEVLVLGIEALEARRGS